MPYEQVGQHIPPLHHIILPLLLLLPLPSADDGLYFLLAGVKLRSGVMKLLMLRSHPSPDQNCPPPSPLLPSLPPSPALE